MRFLVLFALAAAAQAAPQVVVSPYTYLRSEAVPTITPEGFLADTPEVAFEKAKHYEAHARALGYTPTYAAPAVAAPAVATRAYVAAPAYAPAVATPTYATPAIADPAVSTRAYVAAPAYAPAVATNAYVAPAYAPAVATRAYVSPAYAPAYAPPAITTTVTSPYISYSYK